MFPPEESDPDAEQPDSAAKPKGPTLKVIK